MPFSFAQWSRIRALRVEVKRQRHINRELKRQLADARRCIKIQADKNYQVYCWHRDAPREHQILEVPEIPDSY
ncbi:hypothetical protein ACEOHC_003861 [Salmonella enterica]